jgi:carboxylate-amine ligase
VTGKPEPSSEQPPSASALRAAFDGATPYTVGIEDEVMVLDPESFELVPRAEEVLALLDGDPRFKLELPASQLEIVTPACATVDEAVTVVREGRHELAARAQGLAAFAGAGVHPLSPGAGPLNDHPRYEHTVREYGAVAKRQLLCALQVHVAVGAAECALAVYNSSRSFLPLLAALAANAPFYEGRDTGLASVRPKLGQLLPRQGVPPPLSSWEDYGQALRWGAAAGALPNPGSWWWELRPHRRFGTLEFRVPDGQTTVSDGGAIAAVIQSLVVWLAERQAAGEQLETAPTWRIEENRWSACRHGLDGSMVDLESGAQSPTRQLLRELLDRLEPVASRLGAAEPLARARELTERNGAIAQRQVAAERGIEGAAPWLAERFLAE